MREAGEYARYLVRCRLSLSTPFAAVRSRASQPPRPRRRKTEANRPCQVDVRTAEQRDEEPVAARRFQSPVCRAGPGLQVPRPSSGQAGRETAEKKAPICQRPISSSCASLHPAEDAEKPLAKVVAHEIISEHAGWMVSVRRGEQSELIAELLAVRVIVAATGFQRLTSACSARAGARPRRTWSRKENAATPNCSAMSQQNLLGRSTRTRSRRGEQLFIVPWHARHRSLPSDRRNRS